MDLVSVVFAILRRVRRHVDARPHAVKVRVEPAELEPGLLECGDKLPTRTREPPLVNQTLRRLLVVQGLTTGGNHLDGNTEPGTDYDQGDSSQADLQPQPVRGSPRQDRHNQDLATLVTAAHVARRGLHHGPAFRTGELVHD